MDILYAYILDRRQIHQLCEYVPKLDRLWCSLLFASFPALDSAMTTLTRPNSSPSQVITTWNTLFYSDLDGLMIL